MIEVASEASHKLRIQAKGNVKGVSQSLPVCLIDMLVI